MEGQGDRILWGGLGRRMDGACGRKGRSEFTTLDMGNQSSAAAASPPAKGSDRGQVMPWRHHIAAHSWR